MAISILVINCGSSSIKYALISERREDRIYGLAENLGAADARIKGITVGGEALELFIPYADHATALETLLARLANYNPQAIGHRVVHGGNLTKAELLTPEIVSHIEAATPLAATPAVLGARRTPSVATAETAAIAQTPAVLGAARSRATGDSTHDDLRLIVTLAGAAGAAGLFAAEKRKKAQKKEQ